MIAPRARPAQLILALSIFAVLFYSYQSYYNASFGPDSSFKPAITPFTDDLSTHARANTTLGFGAILAVSKDGSPRQHALIQAANVTELDITIPPQPRWTKADVDKFKNGPETHIETGSVLAWLGHHNALKWFLETGLETVLIIEDDVDWDIRLRSLEVPLAAHAARTLLGPASVSREINYYWGDPSLWDLLYLGHCGDYFNGIDDGIGPGFQKPTNLTTIPHQIWDDPSLPDRDDLHPFTSKLMTALGVPDQKRTIHRSKFPLCTFGYAVTRPAAWKLVNILAPPKEPPPETKKPALAYDVAVLKACEKGFSNTVNGPIQGGLKCYTVNPELMHHSPGDSEIAEEEAKVGHVVTGLPPVDKAGADQVKHRHETSNINCGFWGGHFAFPDGNKGRLEFLRTNVGRAGKCLKPGREKLHAVRK